MTKTNGPANSDANVGAELVVNDPTIAAGDCVEVLGDSAYATAETGGDTSKFPTAAHLAS